MSMDSISQGSSPRMGAMSEDQMSIRSCEELCSRIKLMCSYGGKIMPRPHDNQLRYIGGESRILVVNRNISFADLMAKLSKISGKEIAIKYQLPNEDLDALVSVLGEDDLESMIEEYDRLEARDSSSRLRLFLFPTNMKQQDQPQQNLMDFHEDNRNAEQRFVDAINGLNLGRNVEPARAIHQPVSSQLPDFLFGFEAREIRSPVQEQSPSQAQFTQQPWQQAVGPLITLQSSSPLHAPASPPVSLKQQSPVGSLMTLQSSSPPPLPPQKSASPPVSVKQQTTVGSLMTLQSSSPPPLPSQMPQPTFASPPASLKQQTPVLKPPISPSQNVGIIGQSVEEHPPQPEIPVSPPQAKVPSTQDEDKVGLPDLVLEIGQTEGKHGEALHTTDPKDVDGKNLFLDVRSKVELSNQDLQVTPDPSLQKELEILEKQPVKSPDKPQGISYEIKGEKQQESPGTNKEFQESPKKVLPKSPPLPPQHQERLVVLDALPTLPPSQQQERLITYDQLPQQQQQQQQQLQQERVVAYDQQQQHQQLMQQTERQLFDQDDPTPPSFQQEPFSGILPRKVVLDPSLLPQHQQQAILQQAGPYQQVYANAIYWQAEDDSQHPQLQYESGLRSGNVILQRVVPSQVPAASIQRLSSAPQMRVAQGVANNANLNRQFSAGYADVYQQQMQMQMQQQQIQMQMQMQLQQQQQSPPVVQQQQQQSPPAVQPPLPQGKISYVQQNTKNLHSYQPSPRFSPVKIQDQIGAERVIAKPPASGTRVQQQPIAVDPANDPTAYEPSAPQLHFIDKAPLTPQYVNSTPFPDLFKDAGIHHVYQEVPVSVEEGQARRLAVHQVARGS